MAYKKEVYLFPFSQWIKACLILAQYIEVELSVVVPIGAGADIRVLIYILEVDSVAFEEPEILRDLIGI